MTLVVTRLSFRTYVLMCTNRAIFLVRVEGIFAVIWRRYDTGGHTA